MYYLLALTTDKINDPATKHRTMTATRCSWYTQLTHDVRAINATCGTVLTDLCCHANSIDRPLHRLFQHCDLLHIHCSVRGSPSTMPAAMLTLLSISIITVHSPIYRPRRRSRRGRTRGMGLFPPLPTPTPTPNGRGTLSLMLTQSFCLLCAFVHIVHYRDRFLEK